MNTGTIAKDEGDLIYQPKASAERVPETSGLRGVPFPLGHAGLADAGEQGPPSFSVAKLPKCHHRTSLRGPIQQAHLLETICMHTYLSAIVSHGKFHQ